MTERYLENFYRPNPDAPVKQALSARHNFRVIMEKLNALPFVVNEATGRIQLPALTEDPTEDLATGQLAVVNNVLRIYNGAAWVNV